MTAAVTSLSRIKVLVLDCQTTGATPERGSLLEIAWCRTRASAGKPARIHSRLVALPEGETIPRRITAITGIAEADLDHAVPAELAWRELRAGAPGQGPELAVIHSAAFELRFLRAINTEHGGGVAFPLEPICTLQIARRLYPELPRRGLHALAGYFGQHTPELKRATAHVEATVVVWRALIRELAGQGVRELHQLHDWLVGPAPARKAGHRFLMPREVRLNLPEGSGVYMFKGSRGRVLYVGKAKSLKRRVNSYFQKRRRVAERTLELLTQVRDVEVFETGSALEAAMLEADRIKRFDPPYNVALRQRDRQVQFFSPDLCSSSDRPGSRHRIGPIPGEPLLRGLGRLQRLLERDRASRIGARTVEQVLARPPEYLPDVTCFREGLALFREAHGSEPLLTLGTALWAARLEATAEPEQDDLDAGAAEEEEDEEWEWTPERVAAAIEWQAVHGAHLVRRARWLVLSSECSLCWKAPDRRQRRRLLTVERGDLAGVGELRRGESLPIPSGWHRSVRARQRFLDAAAYDRLRVLTTEIRRLVAENRAPRLRLGPDIVLDQSRLVRGLRWF